MRFPRRGLSVGSRRAARWRRLGVVLSSALLGSILAAVGPAPPATAAYHDCGRQVQHNFYGAFVVKDQGCAGHDGPTLYTNSWFDPGISVDLESTQPWRFTACRIAWAYRTEPGGTVARPPDIDCTGLVRDMQRYGWTSAGTTYYPGLIYSPYLELWGHAIVRFDHVDWTHSDLDFRYTCPTAGSPCNQ